MITMLQTMWQQKRWLKISYFLASCLIVLNHFVFVGESKKYLLATNEPTDIFSIKVN